MAGRQAGTSSGCSVGGRCGLVVCIKGVTAQVPTLETGEINYEELRANLERNRARPAIINVNIGTTVKGAVDDLDRVLTILQVGECIREGVGRLGWVVGGQCVSRCHHCHDGARHAGHL
eukprot:350436-Chlamydomonas_euryale.AAC.13